MIYFPCLQVEPSDSQIKEAAISNMSNVTAYLDGFRVYDSFPYRRELWMVWTIGKDCSGIDNNLCRAANRFVNPESTASFAVVWHRSLTNTRSQSRKSQHE